MSPAALANVVPTNQTSTAAPNEASVRKPNIKHQTDTQINDNGGTRIISGLEIYTSGGTGVAGPPGPMGPAGPQGTTGPAGPQGTPGSAGPQGATGPAGQQGATGPAGQQGATGPAGQQGRQGEKTTKKQQQTTPLR